MMSFHLKLQKKRLLLLAVAGLFLINSLQGQTTDAGQDSVSFRLSGAKEKMDLVLFGKDLPRDSLRVQLMTNPRYGSEKQRLPLAEAIFISSGGGSEGYSDPNAGVNSGGSSADDSVLNPEPRSVRNSEGNSGSSSEVHSSRNSEKTLKDNSAAITGSTTEEDSPARIMIFRDLPVQKFLGQDIRENYISLHIKSLRLAPFHLSAVYAIGASDYTNQKLLQGLLETIKEKPACLERHSLASYVRPRPLIFKARSHRSLHVEAPVRHLKPGVQEVKWLNILFGDN